jgi:hypothetical protein
MGLRFLSRSGLRSRLGGGIGLGPAIMLLEQALDALAKQCFVQLCLALLVAQRLPALRESLNKSAVP